MKPQTNMKSEEWIVGKNTKISRSGRRAREGHGGGVNRIRTHYLLV